MKADIEKCSGVQTVDCQKTLLLAKETRHNKESTTQSRVVRYLPGVRDICVSPGRHSIEQPQCSTFIAVLHHRVRLQLQQHHRWRLCFSPHQPLRKHNPINGPGRIP